LAVWTGRISHGANLGAMSPVLDHMILPVNDADESVAFYTGVLGFAVYLLDPNPHLVELRFYQRGRRGPV
jgi:Glyoxalase/Bleomycin resistance protein/Dioxygenase superfamily